MEFIAIWLICAVICAAAASARGLNGCLWSVLGFLLGPLGVLMALLWPTPQKVITVVQHRSPIALQGETEPGEQKLCPFCRSWIPAAASVCRYCQRAIGPDTTPALGSGD
jgi:hypothetical protein